MRFLSSVERLAGAISRLSGHTQIKERLIDKGLLRSDRIVDLVKRWANGDVSWMAHRIVPGYEQHGDLNPRNVMLSGFNGNLRVKLIDFARFGVWPAGYDLVRLKLQLALRLLDSPENLSDCFPERIAQWEDLWVQNRQPNHSGWKRDSSRVAYLNFGAIRDEIEKVTVSIISGFEEAEQAKVRYAMNLSELFDLIKMTSYQDASWFKRLWLFARANDSMHRLRAMV